MASATGDNKPCAGPSVQRPSVVVETSNANRILKARIPVRLQLQRTGKGEPELPEPNFDHKNSVELIGRSWAADCTAFAIPEWDLGLDAGYIVQGKRLSNFFVTHVHNDHVHFLTHLKSRSKPPNIFLPSESISLAEQFLDTAQQMTSHMTKADYDAFPWDAAYTFVGVQPGDRHVFDKKRGLVCDVVQMNHSIPCVGYCFSKVKEALKPEFRGLPGREIGRLRQQGVQVTQQETTPMLAFLGDTTVSGIFGDINSPCCNPDQLERTRATILACPTIVMECSFLTDDNRAQANNTKHVLWSDLKPHVQAHPENTFVLMHFSHRWGVQEVVEFFQHPDNFLPNVIPWVPTHGLWEEGTGRCCDEVWSHF